MSGADGSTSTQKMFQDCIFIRSTNASNFGRFLGPLCKTSNVELLDALKDYREPIPVLRTVLSPTAFEVVVKVQAVLLRQE
jgi:hypothetical protein